MEYHTVATLYEELKTKPQDANIVLNPAKVRYYRVTPPSYMWNPVIKTENWNILCFHSDTDVKGRVKEVCELLEPLVGDHGNDIVSKGAAFLQRVSENIEVPLKIFYPGLSNTHLNPTKLEDKAQTELDKLAELVDVDIVVKWLSKKVAADRTIYLVDKRYFIGLERLTAVYPLYSENYNPKIFKPEESLPNLLICRLTQTRMDQLFQLRTREVVEAEVANLE